MSRSKIRRSPSLDEQTPENEVASLAKQIEAMTGNKVSPEAPALQHEEEAPSNAPRPAPPVVATPPPRMPDRLPTAFPSTTQGTPLGTNEESEQLFPAPVVLAPPPSLNSGGNIPPQAPLNVQSFPEDHIEIGDLVQVVNKNNKLYGITLTVGDIRGRRIHGFYLMPGLKKEHATIEFSDLVNKDGIACFGRSRVQSHNPCSLKWLEEHRQR